MAFQENAGPGYIIIEDPDGNPILIDPTSIMKFKRRKIHE